MSATKRLLLGDVAAYHGTQAVRAAEVKCECGSGPCSVEHWLFDCPMPNARAQRSVLLYEVKRLGRKLEALDGSKEHAATLITAQALMVQHGGGTPERKVAGRWCVGCIPEPVVSDKERRAAWPLKRWRSVPRV